MASIITVKTSETKDQQISLELWQHVDGTLELVEATNAQGCSTRRVSLLSLEPYASVGAALSVLSEALSQYGTKGLNLMLNFTSLLQSIDGNPSMTLDELPTW